MYVFWQEFPNFQKNPNKNADAMHYQGVMLENLANFPQTQMATSLHLWGNLIFQHKSHLMYAKHMHHQQILPNFQKMLHK